MINKLKQWQLLQNTGPLNNPTMDDNVEGDVVMDVTRIDISMTKALARREQAALYVDGETPVLQFVKVLAARKLQRIGSALVKQAMGRSLVLRVRLLGSRSNLEVWRRFRVPSRITLAVCN